MIGPCAQSFNTFIAIFYGATTLSITTFTITTQSIMTLSIMGLVKTLSITDTQLSHSA